MYRIRPWIAVAAVVAGSFWACGGEINELDLDRWTNNDRGFERIQEVLRDKAVPIKMRVKALEITIHKGFIGRLNGLLKGLDDNREEIIRKLVQDLKEELKRSDGEYQVDAKDALLILKRFVPREQAAGIDEAIAAWAFAGVDWDTPVSQVRERLNSRISAGQISALGPYAYKVAAILVGRGLAVKQMLEVLRQAKDKRRAAELALRGLKRLHKEWNPRDHHIAALSKLPSADTAKYLLDIYYMTNKEGEPLPDDIRDPAFNALAEMLCPPVCHDDRQAQRNQAKCETCCEKNKGVIDSFEPGACACRWDGKSSDYRPCRPHAGIARKSRQIGRDLRAAMKYATAEDPFNFAIWILRLSGVESLNSLLSQFTDEPRFFSEKTDTYVTNFCNYVNDEGFGRQAIPVFMSRLNDKGRLVRIISVVCLKVLSAQSAKDKLRGVARDGTTVVIEDIMGGKGMTLGRLATNAVDGLTMLKALELTSKPQVDAAIAKRAALRKQLAAKKITEAAFEKGRAKLERVIRRYNRRSDSIREWHDKVGEAYASHVEKLVAEGEAQDKPTPPPSTKTSPPAKTPAGAPGKPAAPGATPAPGKAVAPGKAQPPAKAPSAAAPPAKKAPAKAQPAPAKKP